MIHLTTSGKRIRISLLRNNQPQARAASTSAEERSLAHIIWHEYEARILPTDEHWWTYKQPEDLAYHLYEAGKLLFAYGVPWLENFEAVADEVAAMYSEEFVRMWRLYLAGSSAGFQSGTIQLFQILFTPGGNNNVPWTREYQYPGESSVN